MPRENVTLTLDDKLWKGFKIFCIQNDLIASDEFENFMRQKMKTAKS